MKKYFLFFALIVCIGGIAQPTITSFSPTSAAIGANITITGTNFNSIASDNIVFFGGVKATVNTATATSLNVTVPVGAGFQPISVTNNRLTVYSKTPFNVIFTGAATPVTTASFTATNIGSTRHDAVIFADIDGDGKPDMIATNKVDSTISVYKNTSTGGGVSFETKVDFKIGSRPRFIVAGDINGDGKQDIISANISIANTEDASFTVLINKSVAGQVSMTAQKKNISRGTFPGMSFGDFDLDGKPDIAVASMDSSQLVIYGNASSADSVKFNTEKKISLPFPPEYIINADLDGDGKTDLLLTKSGDSSLYVAKNTSTPGVFSFATPLNIGFASLSMSYNPFAIADFNNDGKPDIAFPNLYTGKVMVFKNTSTSVDISFTGVSNFTVGSKPLTLAAADLTGDGLPDLIVNNTVSATMSVLKNTSSAGSFAFDTKFDFPVSNTGYTADGIAAIADIDLNGAYDFVGYNASVNGFLVYQNRMLLPQAQTVLVSSFTPTSGKQGDTITIKGKTFATTSEVRFGGVAAASFTIVSDSLIKAVVGNGRSGAVRVTATIGTDSLAGFTFTISKPKINSLTPPSGTTGDLISIGGSGFTGTTAVSFGETPATSFTIVSDSLIKAVVGTGGNGAVRVTTPGGYDSLLAFVFLPSNAPKIISMAPLSGPVNSIVTITGNNFSTTPANNIVYFGAVKATVTAATVTSLTVKVPLAGSYLPVSVTVNGYTGFSKTPFNISFSGNPQELARTDLFQRKQGDSTLNKSFIEDVFSHDLDGDGKVDVVAIIWNGEGQNNGPWTTNAGAILVGRNTGSIGNPSFSAQQIIPTGLKPSEVSFADIDGDGKTDILTANQNDNTISILRNTSTPGTISFEAKKDLAINSNNPITSLQRNSVATGDLNNDGKPDIVAAVGNNSTFSIFTNTSTPGTISFATRIDIDRPNSTVSSPVSIVIADFNSDGKSDLAFSNATTNFVSVYKNITPIPGNIPITLGVKQDIPLNSSTYRIGADDLDNDGKPDIISADNNSLFLRILRNTSNIDSIIFAAPVAIETGTQSVDFALNNFDGNGKADIAISRVNTDSLILLQNTSIPGSISFTKYKYKTNKGDNFTGRMTSADFDGDGLQDLAAKNLISLVPGSGYNTFFIDVILNRFSTGPAVASFTPKTGGANTSVTIKGSKFNGTTAVYFGSDTAKSFTVVSDSVITAIVGNGASGYVKVKAPAGTDSLAGFVFLPPATPKIISFSPLSAGPGNTVAIKGQNLTGTSVVSFGAVSATSFTVVSDSLINAIVGTGASGLVKISTASGKDSLAGFTFVSPKPIINNFTPKTGGTGTVVTISGSKFTGTIAVSFGGSTAAFTVVSDTLINAAVGTGASGFVSVKTALGSDSLSGFVFSAPEINLLDSTKNKLSFSALKGAYSTAQYFVIGGKRLQSSITITAPPYFQLSRNADTGYSSTLSVTAVNNTVDSTKIYVRFKLDSVAAVTGNISVTAVNAATKNVTVNGAVCDSVILATPLINSISKDSTICIRDSVRLTVSNGTYNLYNWSTGDSTSSITVKKSSNIIVQVGSKTGCFSLPSTLLKIIKDTNAVPILALTGDTTLVSSSAPNYRWYFNNNLITGSSSNKLVVKKIGFYGVETSNDKICWSRSNDYPIVLLPAPLVNDSASVKAYPNPATGGTFNVVVSLQRATNIVVRVTVTDASGVVLLQTNKFIFFGREIKIPITLNAAAKGTVFIKVDINGDIKTQTVILQ